MSTATVKEVAQAQSAQASKETLEAFHHCQELSHQANVDHDMAPVLGVVAFLSFLGWVAYWIWHAGSFPSIWGWVLLVIIVFVAGTAADMEQRGNRKWRQAKRIEASAKKKLRSSVE